MRQRGLHVGIWLGIAFGTLLLVGCAGGGEKQSAPRVVEIYLDRSAGGRANELYGFSSERSGLLDLQQLLRLAAEDVQTLGVVLRADGGGLSLAEAQSLARSVQAFRATGKPVIVYSDYYDNATYLLAAHADRVLLSPLGTVDLIGLRAEVLFFKETLDKLGIQAELVQAGAYKSAAEPYTRTRLSPEAEAMLNRLLDELFDQLVEGIALARGRGREEVIRWIDGGPYSAQEALERGLVDGLEYPDALPTVSKSLVSASAEPTYIADRVERDGGPGVLELLRELMRTPGEPPLRSGDNRVNLHPRDYRSGPRGGPAGTERLGARGADRRGAGEGPPKRRR
ncbi:MAG: hypothetical protein KatS3mg115_0016 [Candidatus Poribacteria bacterium]|nr:MAG: hypothetical protein KatS3mg115_0016 [Candidatus Poribacteria bacterium]